MLLQFVRRLISVIEIAVRFRVVRELLGLAVPFEIRPRLVRDIRDERGGRAAVARLDIAIALGPAAHTVQEVAYMASSRAVKAARPFVFSGRL